MNYFYIFLHSNLLTLHVMGYTFQGFGIISPSFVTTMLDVAPPVCESRMVPLADTSAERRLNIIVVLAWLVVMAKGSCVCSPEPLYAAPSNSVTESLAICTPWSAEP